MATEGSLKRRMAIAARMGMIEASGIRKVFDLTTTLKNSINLSIGQPDFDTPQPVKDEAIAAISSGSNSYTQTQGVKELREAVARKLRLTNGIETSPDNVLITSGVMGGLLLACLVLFDKGDEVILPDPYFLANPQLINLMGGKAVYLDTYPDFLPRPQDIERKITERTKAIIINSPNNPTGRMYPRDLLKRIAHIAEANDLLVISDEIYERFAYGEKHLSIGSFYENTLTLNGFSKSHAIPGWRIGYATGPERIVSEMKKLQPYSFVCAPSFAQKALAKTIDADISDHVRVYKERRDHICHELKGDYDIVVPEGAFYIFPRAPDGKATAFVEKAIANNLLIVPGSVFSQQDTHFRLSFAAPDREIERGIEVLKRIAR